MLAEQKLYFYMMNKVYKYGFWILVIYVCLDISLYLTNYECMNMCIPDYLNFSTFIIGNN